MTARLAAFASIALAAAQAFAAAGDALLQSAREALRDGMWSAARKKAREARENGAPQDGARLTEAEAAQSAGDYAGALAALDGGPAGFAASVPARFRRASILAACGRAAEAIDVLSAIDAAPGDNPAVCGEKAGALRLAARLSAKSGDIPRAEAFCARAWKCAAGADAAVRMETALDRAVLAAGRAGGAADARAILEKSGVMQTAGRTGDESRFLYATLLPPEKRDAALAAIASGEGVFPDTAAKASILLARTAVASGDSAKAVSLLRDACARAKDGAVVYAAALTLGRELVKSPATRAEGIETTVNAVRMFPDAAGAGTALLELGDALYALGDFASAAEQYALHLEAFPGAATAVRAMAGRARALYKTGRPDEALSLFRRAAALSEKPGERAMLEFKQGDVLLGSGRFTEAAGAYAEAAAADPAGALAEESAFRRADALERAGRKEEALAVWRKLDEANGKLADESALRIGAAESAAGRHDAAVKAFSRVLSRRPAGKDDETAARARVGRGNALYCSFKFEEALADFEEAQSDGPLYEMARYSSAMCLLNLGRNARARAVAAEALARCAADSPWRPKFLLWLGKFDFNERAWESAQAELLEYVKLRPGAPDAPDAALWAARCAFERGEFPAAVETVGRLVSAHPSAPAAYEGRILQAEALRELARLDEAALVLRDVASPPAAPDTAARAAVLRGDCLFAMGGADPARYSEALATYKAAAAGDALPPSAKIAVAFKTARALEKLSRADEAAELHYSGVIMAYRELAKNNAWAGEDARTAFVRSACALADYHERKGSPRKAVAILRLAAATLPASSGEISRRAARLEAKGFKP